MTEYQAQLSLEYSVRIVANSRVGLFNICSGPRPGGHFLQFEAWEARTIAVNSTIRAVERELDDDETTRWVSIYGLGGQTPALA